jgi:hypothetical protein
VIKYLDLMRAIVGGYLDMWRRRIDLRNFWPLAVYLAHDEDQARAAFYFHCINDPAWTNYFNETELAEFVGKLRA